MLQVFSDAGFWNHTAIASTLIFEDWEQQLAFFCQKYEQIESCTISEIMGVVQGLQWVLDNRPDVKSIEVFVDNLSVAQKLCDYVDNAKVKQGAYHALWMHLYVICDSFEKVVVYHVPSHQQEHNPNKACDILCSAALRPYKNVSEV